MASTSKRGSAWTSSRASERAANQQAFASDPKYKKFTQQVEKCLNSFDNVHEWADCIAFLKQLLKTFQSYMQFKEIPRKLIVAKRLAQCLNPALPTGVHQRALDVYAHILSVLGPEGLARDLPLWSSGLFPFFEYAATSVKPTLLNLYEVYYLPLQDQLRPNMKSFILALLPGLEEETGEFFDKVLGLLDRLSGTVSPAFFLQNIWLVMLTSPSARGTSIHFLSRRLPRLHADEDITPIVGRDIGLMIRAFAAALEDDNLLVRRGALDLLFQAMRIDSAAVTKAQHEDRIILMRAATGVVLRRDLSLNRRLYTWLLGPDERSEVQIAYLNKHALGLLRETLKGDMISPTSDYSESRPFKVFISLLDKWEIGAALTDALVLDAFKAVKTNIESNPGSREDVLLTASTLYEAIEPHNLWKQLLRSVISDITDEADRMESVQMALFVVETFTVEDDEVQTVHLPVVFAAIMDLLNSCVHRSRRKSHDVSTLKVFKLQEALLHRITPSALLHRPELNAEMQHESVSKGPYAFACMFYGITLDSDWADSSSTAVQPVAAAFEDLVDFTSIAAKSLQGALPNPITQREVLCLSLHIMETLLAPLDGSGSSLSVSWHPFDWLASLMSTLDSKGSNFILVDRTISLAVALHSSNAFEVKLSIDERPVISRLLHTLFRYLRQESAAYHVRAVTLIWSLEAISKHAHVESIIAQTMTAEESRIAQEAYEAFGVVWRLTEDHMLPGFRFKVPMMIVLDSLKNEDPCLRRVGETWMRCSLKSYLRVLDPILCDLLDPNIRHVPVTVKVHGRELRGFVYERPFDQRYVNHILETLLSVVRFGGQGFAKTTRSTHVKRAHHEGLLHYIEKAGFHADATYLDVVTDILIRFLQAEPDTALVASMHPFNMLLQSTAVDLLQAIVSRGEVDSLSVENMESAVIGKLFFCVHKKRLDLQNKLLHLLHSLVSASTAASDSRHTRSSTNKHPSKATVSSDTSATPVLDEGSEATYSVNPLLIQTLTDGVSIQSNRPVLQHWLDFILMALPQVQITLQAAVVPMNDCICRQLRGALVDVVRAFDGRPGGADDVSSTTTDAELIMFLNALERLVLLGLANASEASQTEEDAMSMAERSGAENSGLLGYMSNVFSTDQNVNVPTEQLSSRSPGYRSLHEGVKVLYAVWSTLPGSLLASDALSSNDETFNLVSSRARARCRRVLEHLFRVQSMEVLESIVDCWHREHLERESDSAFDLTDVLIANAQHAVQMLCEAITYRQPVSERLKKPTVNHNVSDLILLQFLEEYLQRLEGPIALQVWGRFLQLAKDIPGSSREFKVQIYPTLRCLCVLAEKITQTTAMDDRRVRKELQDTFSKLLDQCVTFVGRSSDQGTWMRRNKETLATNGRDSPALRDEKKNASMTSLQDSLKVPTNVELTTQISHFIAWKVVPMLRKILVDNDKTASACSNIVYYIVNPSVKARSKPLDVDDTTIQIIQEMARVPSALKAWRGPVADILNDNRVFNSTSAAAANWKPVVKALYDVDKTAFPELLGKVATAPSANIFTNKEYEMLLRSLNLRRLSFVVFSAEKNYFLTQLPSIQEKLVDIFKNDTSALVQGEVYLCIRALLCRLSPHNLTSFWPVILTELYRVFEQVLAATPSDGSEDLQVVLSACKTLDLLLVLQTEEFQVHQWIFITDTVDAVYRPDNWFPQAMMDELAEVVGNLPAGEGSTLSDAAVESHLPQTPSVSHRPMRRPLLRAVRQIDSIRDLVPFFSHASIASFEGVYASGGNVDWDAVEQGIMDDMFDGR